MMQRVVMIQAIWWMTVGSIALAKEPPNIVLIMCDDLGWADVGFNGNKVIRTPNLDLLAKAGLRFNRFYAGSAVCSPTRGSVQTGRHPYRYGIHDANSGHMKPGEKTLAELLSRRGYRTGHFGKWHLGTLTKTILDSNRGGPRGIDHYAPPQDHGFDTCFATEAKVPTYDPMLRPKNGSGSTWWDPVRRMDDAVLYNTRYWNEQGEVVNENLRGDDSRVIMDRAIPFVEDAARQGEPFLAVIWFHAPHLPVVAGPRHTAMYTGHTKYAQHYYGCITAMDEQVGRLRSKLNALGVEENTLITFCSDNGPEGVRGEAPGSAGPFRGRKRDLYEGGVRVPAFIVWPKRIGPERTTDFPAVTSDYLPTILEVIGEKVPDTRPVDGVNLVRVFDGTMKQRPAPIAFHLGGKQALIDNRYKIVRYTKGMREGNNQRIRTPKKDTGWWELYDLLDDSGETNNLADQHPEIVNRMSGEFQRWLASCRVSAAGKDYSLGKE
ncbi:MAG: sulfatase family protein [Planctomycetota bacterium]|jgi:arylsulfatase A-like enzyme